MLFLLHVSSSVYGRKKCRWQTGNPSPIAPHEEGDKSRGLGPCQVLEIARDSTSWFLNLNLILSQTWAKFRLPGKEIGQAHLPSTHTLYSMKGPLTGQGCILSGTRSPH